jgi:hypothetical protein
LHWGKYNTFLTPDRVRNRYGAAVDQWLTSRNTLLENAMVREIFDNGFTTTLELTS